MRLIDLSCPTPAENLALDEALLNAVDAGQAGDTLRFWECPVPFVVLGTGQVFHDEVHDDACRSAGLPVLRRCSAGGCVLQGPGSFNYTLIYRMHDHPELRNLHDSYCTILKQVAAALSTDDAPLRVAGVSDLACGDRKVSGNAQRRKRNAFLHHGTLLYRPDYATMATCLKEPKDRPDYRGEKNHEAFVGQLDHTPESLRRALSHAFAPGTVSEEPLPVELEAMAQLVAEKYTQDAWNRRR
jgi:lipoate-protein ligase A